MKKKVFMTENIFCFDLCFSFGFACLGFGVFGVFCFFFFFSQIFLTKIFNKIQINVFWLF